MSGKGLNNLPLVQGLRDNHIRRRVTKEHQSWDTMEDTYRSINKTAKSEVRTRAYQEPKYNSISKVSTAGIHEVSYNKGKRNKNILKQSFSFLKLLMSHNSSTCRKQH